MPLLRSLNKFSDLYRFTFQNVFSLSVWLPLFGFAAITGLFLIGLVYYQEPAIYAVLNPFLKAIGLFTEELGISPDYTEQFSHYPTHFRLLAIQFEWAKLPAALLLEGVAITLASRAFGKRLMIKSGTSDGGSFFPRIGMSSWTKIILLWLLVYLMIMVVAYILPSLFENWLFASPRRAQIFDVGLFTLTNILISPFIYAFPLFGIGVGVERLSPSLMEALKRSLQLFRKYPFISVFIVLLPSFVLVYPLTWAVSPSAGFATKLQPELMAYLLGGLIIGNMLLNFFFAGAAVKLILDERR